MTEVAPGGISDHQAAATAARVDAIQASWQSANVMKLAQFSMIIDLCFIGIYAFGAAAGGLLFARQNAPMLRRLGIVILISAIVFALTDCAETVAQFVQAIEGQGSNRLAGLAASVRPIKSVTFLVTLFGLLAALFLRRRARRSA
jgi:uncharacterized membrane protein YfcA